MTTLSYPKRREIQSIFVPIYRTDSSTEKCRLPKGAIITAAVVTQTSDASTNVGTFDLGWSGTTQGILAGFTMATTKVGQVHAATKYGTAIGTKLTSDVKVISTYTVGSSTAGGEGFVEIQFFVPGPGETLYS